MLFELFLLENIQDIVELSHGQFGFKRNHSTNICTRIAEERSILI